MLIRRAWKGCCYSWFTTAQLYSLQPKHISYVCLAAVQTRCLSTSQQRRFPRSSKPCYHWEPGFEDPVIPKKCDEFTEEFLQQRKFVKIKAAKHDDNCFFYTDPTINKFINMLIQDGKKHEARKALERAFFNIKFIQVKKYNLAETEEEKANIEINPRKIFFQALDNCTPLLLTKRYVRGGVTYRIPVAVSEHHRVMKAMRFLRDIGREKKGPIHFSDVLAKELLDAYENKGKAVQKKQEIHRKCEENRAYAHFRWAS